MLSVSEIIIFHFEEPKAFSPGIFSSFNFPCGLLEPSSRLYQYVEVLQQCGSRLMPLPLLAALQLLLSVSALAMGLA